MAVIIISGTPCTGKTTLARLLAEKLKYIYIDGNELIKQYNLGEEFDKERDSWIVDAEKFSKVVEDIIASEKNIIIDSHLSHYIPCDLVDLCIITKCNLKVLKKRLEERGYDKKKVSENLDSEIFGVCEEEAKERGHNVVEIDTTKGISDNMINKIIENLNIETVNADEEDENDDDNDSIK